MADPSIPAGWPCALLSGSPPAITDRQTAPTADEILPQVLSLTPRGAAFGTDEAGDGQGASPVQLRFWRGVAAWVADQNTRESAVAAQALPSAITYSLADWETELGLPGPCLPVGRTEAARKALVRARFGALGGASPAYFICLAASLGYAVTLEEPGQFVTEVSECVGPGLLTSAFEIGVSQLGLEGDPLSAARMSGYAGPGDQLAGGRAATTAFTVGSSQLGLEGDPLEGFAPGDDEGDQWKFLVVRLPGALTAFTCGESQLGAEGDPLEGYTPARDLECEVARVAPPHVKIVFHYT